jgi:RNA polymerase sigma factor (sigma-70 family)
MKETEVVFADLIARVRRGDEDAAVELLRRYEPSIRRAIRLQLRDPRLRRFLDSTDICQSVMASFFLRAAAGQYDLNDPAQLVKLLTVMARNKLAAEARKMHVLRRTDSPTDGSPGRNLVDPDPSPSHQIAGRELMQQFRGNLSKDECQLFDFRAAGKEWAEIGHELGASPDALRKRLSRAFSRIAPLLGLDDFT